MDLNKFENFVDGEDFLSKPITNDLRETQYLGDAMEIDTDDVQTKKKSGGLVQIQTNVLKPSILREGFD